jgi:hypothetical protein
LTLAERRKELHKLVAQEEIKAHAALMPFDKLRVLHQEVAEALKVKVHTDQQCAKIRQLDQIMQARQAVMHTAAIADAIIDELDEAGCESFKLGPLG